MKNYRKCNVQNLIACFEIIKSWLTGDFSHRWDDGHATPRVCQRQVEAERNGLQVTKVTG